MRAITIISFILLKLVQGANGQNIEIKEKQSLNTVLNELIEKHHLLISYDESYTAGLTVKARQVFLSPSTFLAWLQKKYPIKVDTVGNNVVIRQLIRENNNQGYIYKGTVYDGQSGCGLPHSELVFNNYLICSADDGSFFFRSEQDSAIACSVRYLGYDILDTLIQAGANIRLPMRLRPVVLNDVLVTQQRGAAHNANVGTVPGLIRLNPVFVKRLPGYGETNLYSFMRLMPGVLATGENPNDISIRGSLEGQNEYVFNHFRIYTPWYKLNDIGTVNPLLIKDVEIFKGGYDASRGENTGGLVKFTGAETLPQKAGASLFVNNFVANGTLELPLFKKLALSLAARKNIKRHTDKEPEEDSFLTLPENDNLVYFMNTKPRYGLIDANAKLVYSINRQDQVSLAAFRSKDQISMADRHEMPEFLLNSSQLNRNDQEALSLHYRHIGNKGGRLDMALSFSGITTTRQIDYSYQSLVDYLPGQVSSSRHLNGLKEWRFNLDRRHDLKKGNYATYGGGIVRSHINNAFDTDNSPVSLSHRHNLFFSYLNYHVNLTEKLNADLGCRANYSDGAGKISAEPRLLLNYYIGNNWKIYGAGGIYRQFVYKTFKYDVYQNMIFSWTSAKEYKAHNKSINSCFGARFSQEEWMLSAEYFLKNLSSLTEPGDNRAMDKWRYTGIDLLGKYQSRKLTTWLSSTISSFKEKRGAGTPKKYAESSYDMRHELKWAGTYSIGQFTFSANYVYGSGFKLWHDDIVTGDNTYKRLDMGLFFHHRFPKVLFETGFSVLNVLDATNRKLDEFTRFGIGDNVISYPIYGLPRTPTFFVKISL